MSGASPHSTRKTRFSGLPIFACSRVRGGIRPARNPARAAMPYVQKALADKAVIDLKPFANDEDEDRRGAHRIPAGRQRHDGRRAVNGLRLTGIEFDTKTLA